MKFNMGKHKVLCLFLFLIGTSVIWGPPSSTAAWQKSAWDHFAPNIFLTIVQIFGNSKIAHADLILGYRSREKRKLYRAATLSIHYQLPGRPCMGILKHVLLPKGKICRDYFSLFSFAFGFSLRHQKRSQSLLQKWEMFQWISSLAGSTMRCHFTYLTTKTTQCISLGTGAHQEQGNSLFLGSYERKRWAKYPYFRFNYPSIHSLFSHQIAYIFLTLVRSHWKYWIVL